jgi:hypothetical protein
MVVLRFAPDLPKAEYRVRGSFAIDADAPPDAVQRAFYNCGKQFIQQLENQGWESRSGLYLDPRPHPHYEPMELPVKGIQDRYGPDAYVQTPYTHEGRIDYRFWGMFVRKEIPVQTKEDYDNA